MSSAQHKKLVEGLVAALCAHNIDEAMSYYDSNCEVSLDGQIVMRSRDEIKTKMEQRFSDPNYKVQIIKFLPVEEDDRVHFAAEDTGKRRFEQICIFSKQGKMVKLMINKLNN